jgi:hypothetical protein
MEKKTSGLIHRAARYMRYNSRAEFNRDFNEDRGESGDTLFAVFVPIKTQRTESGDTLYTILTFIKTEAQVLCCSGILVSEFGYGRGRGYGVADID